MLLRYLMLTTSLALLVSCASTQEEKPALTKPDDLEVRTESYGIREPVVFDGDIGIFASSESGRLYISMRNNTDQEQWLTPKDFAIITGPNPQTDLVLLDDNTIDMKRAKPTTVITHQVNFVIWNFKDISFDATGAKLVYNNPRLGVRFPVNIE